FDEGFVIPGEDGKAVAESEVEPRGFGRAEQGFSEEHDCLLRLAVFRQVEAVVALGDERRGVEPHGSPICLDGSGPLSGESQGPPETAIADVIVRPDGDRSLSEADRFSVALCRDQVVRQVDIGQEIAGVGFLDTTQKGDTVATYARQVCREGQEQRYDL